jgi:hypothetical protein
MMEERFIKCPVCGKNLIVKLPNGLGEFKFGKRKIIDGEPVSKRNFSVPVEMQICGMVRMRCLADGCGSWINMIFFPTTLNPIEGFSNINHNNEPIAEAAKNAPVKAA